eukprot:6625098-Alexandrium_andersonii.AAC.1
MLRGTSEAFQLSQETVALFILTAEDEKARFESCWVIGEENVAGLRDDQFGPPPGPRQFVTVADKNGRDVRIAPLVMRVTQGRSIPWITIGRLGRPLSTPESRVALGGYIYHLT